MSRAPDVAVWATRYLGGYWDIWRGTHNHGTYTERHLALVHGDDAALAWLTDHRRRNPR